MGKDQELLDAARSGNLSTVEKILRNRRSGPLASLRRGGPGAKDNSGYTPLHHAALNGHKDIVAVLLSHEAMTNIVDNKGSSPLHLAAWTGNTEIVNLILTKGVLPANVNLTNHDRETPLHSAAQYGHTDAVALLLQHGADPAIRNLKDETPLDLAAQYGRLDTVKLLVRTHPELLLGDAVAVRTHSSLHLASRNGHRSVVQVLLRYGLDVNVHTDGGSALHEAALFGKVDVVRVLLEHGVDLEAEDSRHRTVLDILDDLKTHISQEIATIITNHRTLIPTDDLENANRAPSFGSKYDGLHSGSRTCQNDTSPYYNSISVGRALSPNDRGGYQGVPKQRLVTENGPNLPGDCVDTYQIPPTPRSLESSMEDSDLSMASSLYQTPPPPRELDDAMSVSSYYDTPPSSASRDGFQRTSLPLENEANMLYQVPPPPREALKRMSDPVDSKNRDPRIDRSMICSAGPQSYLAMAPLQVGYKGPIRLNELKPPQKPPRKNMSPHSPTKFHPGSDAAYEFICMTSSGGYPQNDYDSSTSGYSSLTKDQYNYRCCNDGGNEYVDMKVRHSYAAAYENSFPVYTNNWDPSKIPGDKRTFYVDGEGEPSADYIGSPYENVSCHDQKFDDGSPHYASVNRLKGGERDYGVIGGQYSERPTKPNSLNIQQRKPNGSTSDDTNDQPLSPTGYDQPPTPDFPPPSPGTAESGILEKIRPLSQELDGKKSKSVSTENTEDKKLLGLYRGSSTLPSPTATSSEDTCDDTTTMASTGTSDSEQQSTASTITNERPRRHHSHHSCRSYRTAAEKPYENVSVTSNGWTDERRVQLLGPTSTPAYENVALRPVSADRPRNADRKETSLSILSPFDENEEWAKIADIMASFGGGIGTSLGRTSGISSADSIYFAREMEDEYTARVVSGHSGLGGPPARFDLSPVGLWLQRLGVPEYENLLLANGYDDIDFMGGNIIEDQELFEIGIMNAEHRNRIVMASKILPPFSRVDPKVTDLAVSDWLDSLRLGQYKETFQKHCYTSMERVLRMWEVELTTVLEINRLGHKKRILASLGERPPLPHPYENINELNSDLKQLRSEISQLGLGMSSSNNIELGPHGTLRASKMSRKGPAPQPPPRLESTPDSNGNAPVDDKNEVWTGEPLPMRSPSQLFSGIPTSLTTQWRHEPQQLVNSCCNYTAQYLGSTLVRELKGVETTKKSIQKLKKSTNEIVKVPNIILSVSYRGVKFIDAKTKNVVCEHEIRNIHCACQDADDLNHFAYITKDHQSDNHYCHVFSVASMDLATEVILTLGQAFEVAYQLALRDRLRPHSSPATAPLSPSAEPSADVAVVVRPSSAGERRRPSARDAVSPVTPTATTRRSTVATDNAPAAVPS